MHYDLILLGECLAAFQTHVSDSDAGMRRSGDVKLQATVADLQLIMLLHMIEDLIVVEDFLALLHAAAVVEHVDCVRFSVISQFFLVGKDFSAH